MDFHTYCCWLSKESCEFPHAKKGAVNSSLTFFWISSRHHKSTLLRPAPEGLFFSRRYQSAGPSWRHGTNTSPEPPRRNLHHLDVTHPVGAAWLMLRVRGRGVSGRKRRHSPVAQIGPGPDQPEPIASPKSVALARGARSGQATPRAAPCRSYGCLMHPPRDAMVRIRMGLTDYRGVPPWGGPVRLLVHCRSLVHRDDGTRCRLTNSMASTGAHGAPHVTVRLLLRFLP